MYEKINITLAALSVAGLAFIAWSIPHIYETEPLEINRPDAPYLEVKFTPPDFSYAFEVKANHEEAKDKLDKAQAIYDTIDELEPEAWTLTYVGNCFLTMYAATPSQCGNSLGITASGRKVTDDPECHTVAVDPSVIPLGSYLIIEGYPDIYRADDTGSAVKGLHVDIFTTSEAESLTFPNDYANVYIIEF